MLAQTDSNRTATTQPTSTTVEKTAPADWYAAPWIWITAAALFTLLLAALLSNTGNRNLESRR